MGGGSLRAEEPRPPALVSACRSAVILGSAAIGLGVAELLAVELAVGGGVAGLGTAAGGAVLVGLASVMIGRRRLAVDPDLPAASPDEVGRSRPWSRELGGTVLGAALALAAVNLLVLALARTTSALGWAPLVAVAFGGERLGSAWALRRWERRRDVTVLTAAGWFPGRGRRWVLSSRPR